MKLVKRCLKKVLGNARLGYEELESVLVKNEGVLNSRLLTFVYADLSEASLIPSHLVIGRSATARTTSCYQFVCEHAC